MYLLFHDKDSNMSHATSVISNSRKSVLLGTSALVCLALAAPVMADDFVITSGTTTNDGNTINGGDTVTVTGALTITGANDGIKTTNNDTERWCLQHDHRLWQH